MMRRVVLSIHSLLGISAGLVLAVMGVTGALMAFDQEIMTALSPGVVTIAASPAPRLSPDALAAAAMRQRDRTAITRLVMENEPTRAALVEFAPLAGQQRGEQSYLDPATGMLLGRATSAGFFRTVEDVHRWLALPGDANGWGRQITGVAALSLVFFALSGLYLRWPSRPLDWRAWFVLDLRARGRRLYRSLHTVIGGWLLAAYLLSALTGLWWSYSWYQAGMRLVLTGTTAPAQVNSGQVKAGHGDPGIALPIAMPRLDPAWTTLQHSDSGRYRRVTIIVPRGEQPIEMRALPWNARFDRMTDTFRFAAATGALVKADRYADKPAGETIVASILPLHTGAFFGTAGRVVMLTTSATIPLFAVTGMQLYLGRRRRRRPPSPSLAPSLAPPGELPPNPRGAQGSSV